MKRRRNNWFTLGMDAWALGLEAADVIRMRTWRLATGGDPSGTEAERMVREKVDTMFRLQMKAMTGGLGYGTPAARRAVAEVRRKVRANQRRLSKRG